MIKLPDQSSCKLKNQFSSFDYNNSTLMTQSIVNSKYSVWKCDILNIPNSIGLWIGCLPSYYSYLALKPITYGSLSGYEAFKAWTDGNYRRKGFSTKLLEQAKTLGNIFSDSQGMSKSAFLLWKKQKNIQYFDTETNSIVLASSIPCNDLFTAYSCGKRWQMLLSNSP